MSMRDKISKLEIDPSYIGDDVEFIVGYDGADAIIAALPECIQPLKWEEAMESANPSYSPNVATTPFGDYHANDHAFWLGYEHATRCEGREAAKDAAQADYSRRILSAFGIELDQ